MYAGARDLSGENGFSATEGRSFRVRNLVRNIVLATILVACATSIFGQAGITNDYIAYSSEESGTWEIRGMDPVTGVSELLLSVGGSRVWGGAFSPDRTRFAYSSNAVDGNYDLCILELDGSGSTSVINSDFGYLNAPDWVDDNTLIFASNHNVYQINSDGSGLVCLTCSMAGGFRMPVLSSDRSRIAYTRDVGDIEVADFPSFGNMCPLPTPGPVIHMATDWTDNGRITFYTTDQHNIYTVDDCGGDLQNLTPPEIMEGAARFSNDGSWVAFENYIGSNPNHVSNLWVMDANGTAESRKQLTFTTGRYDIEPLDWGGCYRSDSLTILPVAFDIKPGSCPNPLNTRRHGNRGNSVLPVAILGTAEFDVFQVDAVTVTLEGLSPRRYSFEDVATPVGEESAECECHDLGSDGLVDMTLKFNRQELIAQLEEQGVFGLRVPMTIRGHLLDGTPFVGVDCVVIPEEFAASKAGENEALPLSFTLLQNYPNPFNPTTEISFSLPVASDVTISVYNMLGQTVAVAADEHMTAGHHTVTWDGSNVASGVYFYRLSTSEFTDTKKMMLLK